MSNKKSKPMPGAGQGGDAYIRGDAIPVPEVVEMNSDSAWAMWNDAHAAHEAKFADTAPASIADMAAAADPRFAATVPGALNPDHPAIQRGNGVRQPPQPRRISLDDAMLEARKNNRVCPVPPRWQELYQLLPDKKNNQPTPPLVGPAWSVTPSISKRMCLREQLEWAESRGKLEEVLSFLQRLPEAEWHHMDD
jgi:hypothetical protein